MNLLLTGAFNYSKKHIKEFQELGYVVTFIQNEKQRIDLDVSQFHIVVCNQLFLYNDITNFTNLGMIQLTSAGLDRVPLKYIHKKNIKLYNSSNIYSVPIAEWVISKILDVYKENYLFMKQQENSQWIKHKNLRELKDKKIAIVGFGNIGKEIAKRLKSFDTKVFAVDINCLSNGNYDVYLDINELELNMHNFDIIIFSLPLNDDTRGLVDMYKLKLLKKNSILINVSRGEIFKEKELIIFLKNRPDVIAILDVFENEPYINNDFWCLKNAVISPHISYVSVENSNRFYDLLMSNLKKFGGSKNEL